MSRFRRLHLPTSRSIPEQSPPLSRWGSSLIRSLLMLHPRKTCASPVLGSARRTTWYLAMILAGVSLHESGSAARAEPPPLPPAEQAKVNDAVLRGVIYLRSMQGIDGSWAAADKPHRL